MKSSLVKYLEHIDDLFLSAFPCFIIVEQYSVQNYTLLDNWEGSIFTYHIPSWHMPSSVQRM